MAELPLWEEVEERLEEMAAPVGPAECHGVLCGLFCAAAENPATLWLRDALDREPDQPPPPPLDRLYRDTARQIDDMELGFALLLPADERSLEERAMALSAWCGGFAYGLGAGGLSEGSLAQESAEFLADLIAIGRVEMGPDDDEAAYAEVVEYVRVGVLTLRIGGGRAVRE